MLPWTGYYPDQLKDFLILPQIPFHNLEQVKPIPTNPNRIQ